MRTALTSLPCPIDDMIRTRVYESGRKGGKAQRSFRVKEFEPQSCWARRLCWNCMFAFAFTPACLNHRSEWRPIKGSKDQRGGEIVWKAKPFLFISHEHKLENLANRPLLRITDRLFLIGNLYTYRGLNRSRYYSVIYLIEFTFYSYVIQLWHWHRYFTFIANCR